MIDFSVQLISNKPDLFDEVKKECNKVKISYFDGSGYPSFSKLVNSAIAASQTEHVIIISDKVRPTDDNFYKIILLLEQGYSLASLYNFAFFGFKKELFRQIGLFDERYVGGGFEDYDMVVRLIESNLAFYITQEAAYIKRSSSWGDYSKAYPHWCTKWKHYWEKGNPIPIKLERAMPEEKYNYDLGPNIPSKVIFGHRYSHCTDDVHVTPFFRMNIR